MNCVFRGFCYRQLIRQYEQSPVKYDADALEFQHAREIKKLGKKVRRRSSLKTYAVSIYNLLNKLPSIIIFLCIKIPN